MILYLDRSPLPTESYLAAFVVTSSGESKAHVQPLSYPFPNSAGCPISGCARTGLSRGQVAAIALKANIGMPTRSAF